MYSIVFKFFEKLVSWFLIPHLGTTELDTVLCSRKLEKNHTLLHVRIYQIPKPPVLCSTQFCSQMLTFAHIESSSILLIGQFCDLAATRLIPGILQFINHRTAPHSCSSLESNLGRLVRMYTVGLVCHIYDAILLFLTHHALNRLSRLNLLIISISACKT
jgi:hypothetical protein